MMIADKIWDKIKFLGCGICLIVIGLADPHSLFYVGFQYPEVYIFDIIGLSYIFLGVGKLFGKFKGL